jgi:hypothetical protein
MEHILNSVAGPATEAVIFSSILGTKTALLGPQVSRTWNTCVLLQTSSHIPLQLTSRIIKGALLCSPNWNKDTRKYIVEINRGDIRWGMEAEEENRVERRTHLENLLTSTKIFLLLLYKSSNFI